MKNARQFDAKAKARITRAETVEHGHIPKGSFGSVVQSVVDRQTPKSKQVAKAGKARR